MFRRKIYSKLARWKNEQRGSSALLIEGQRRVGKSTIVEEFARREYRSYIRLDFSRCSRETHDLFNDVSDLDYIFLQLQLQSSVQLFPRESVIIFDEVQLCPRARQAIKALVHDHRYDYIETGSLISIRKNVKDILIPSEEYRLYMYPMDFEEFLWAFDDEATVPLLRQMYEKKRAVGSAAHRKLMRTFHLYMLIGGMPQAVTAYLSAKNFVDVDRIKRAIVELYEADFHKIDGTGRLSRLFADIPTQLHRRASRYSMAGALGRNRTQGRSAPNCRTCRFPRRFGSISCERAERRPVLIERPWTIQTLLVRHGALYDPCFSRSRIYRQYHISEAFERSSAGKSRLSL